MGSGLPQSRRRFLSHKSLDRPFRSVFNVPHKYNFKYNVILGIEKKQESATSAAEAEL